MICGCTEYICVQALVACDTVTVADVELPDEVTTGEYAARIHFDGTVRQTVIEYDATAGTISFPENSLNEAYAHIVEIDTMPDKICLKVITKPTFII